MPLWVLVLSGCAALPFSTAAPGASCPAGHEPFTSTHLVFGTARSFGVVTEDEWAEFLRQEVTARFPQGLTVWRAAGQWQGEDGKVIAEGSWVLNLLHPDTPDDERRIREISDAYKKTFAQEAVLRVKSSACVAF
jgi:Protein of unknown function (DUF3574)